MEWTGMYIPLILIDWVVVIAIIISLIRLNGPEKIRPTITVQSLLLVALVAPLGEEIIFRQYLNSHLGIWISSIIFVAIHLPNNYLSGLKGVWWCYVVQSIRLLVLSLYLSSLDSILYQVLVHGIHNIYAILLVMAIIYVLKNYNLITDIHEELNKKHNFFLSKSVKEKPDVAKEMEEQSKLCLKMKLITRSRSLNSTLRRF